MKENKVTDSITYIGVNDSKLDLFENQYFLPNGISYNSYLIRDEKNVVMDTVDGRVTNEWMEKLETALNGEKPDYLVMSHLEPDHGSNIELLSKKYPDMKLVGSAKAFEILTQFFKNIENLEERKVVVKENETLKIGKHELKFIMAPMVHWPEVMVTYEKTEKVLFSADAFGKFGTLDTEEEWDCEARRYYFNIVGKYGVPVQALLKKCAGLDIKMICPLHGPILKDKLEYYINKYDIWSSYKPEVQGTVVAYASIHGNTAEAAKKFADVLLQKGEKKVSIFNLARDDMAEAVEDAFKYSKLVLAASSYDGEVFPPMDQFLRKLKSKNYQNRKVSIIENGSWAPSAAKCMKEIIGKMKDINLVEPVITIKSRMDSNTVSQMEDLAEKLVNN